jgi:NAD(P)-dependent dehydrogenase (short-subunit alcohol dehydrogenase family)
MTRAEYSRPELPLWNCMRGGDVGVIDGKAVVVTGAGRGIGAAIAKLAAAEGARVVVGDIDREVAERVAAEIVQAGGKAVAQVADISDWNAAAGLVQSCVDAYGRIDGLVNNAGLYRVGRVEEMTEADIRALVDANLLGTAFMARHAVPHMIRQRSGSIVNVTSGAQFGIPTTGAYGGTKGAVASFTYTWSAELKTHNVRVNAFSPRALTRMSEVSSVYWAERGLSRPRPSEAPAEDNAPGVVFLLSDAASDVTGQILRIDGRQLSLVAHPGVALPVLEREAGWDIASIAKAFRSELARRQLPTGVVGLDVRPAEIVPLRWKD